MTKSLDIVKSLLDKDGSCRDLNFEAPTWEGVKKLLNSLEGDFKEISGTDQEGKTLTAPYSESDIAEAQKGGYVHFSLKSGRGLIKNLQVFICPEDDGAPFIELTFFPEDVEQTNSIQSEFIAWVQKQQSLLEARRYYARYENASWHFGDIGEHSGVFLVSDDVKKNS